MKKLIYITIIFSLILMFSANVIAAEQMATAYTVDAAQKRAVENNRQVAIDDLEIKAKETALKNANHDAAMLGDAYGGDRVLNNWITREVKTMEAATNLEVAKRTKQDNIDKLKRDVYSTILDIVLAEKEYEKEEIKLEILIERLNMAKVKYASKTITEDDLQAAEYDLESKKLDMEALKESKATLDMQLKKYLNLPFGGEILKVDAKLVMDTYKQIDIDKLISAQIEADTNVYAKGRALKAAEKTMELTAKIYKEGESTFDDNKVNLEDARKNYDDAKVSLEINIRNMNNDLLNIKDKQELAVKYEALAKKKLDKAYSKYSKGMISKNEYLSVKESWADARYNTFKALRNFSVKNTEWLVCGEGFHKLFCIK